jgi:glucose dehydrogenase
VYFTSILLLGTRVGEHWVLGLILINLSARTSLCLLHTLLEPLSTFLSRVAMARFTTVLAVMAAAMFQTALASCPSNTGLVQMVTYVKRHPSYTREEFWDYWDTQHAPKVAPLAAYFNITRYQQVSICLCCKVVHFLNSSILCRSK